MCSKQPFRFFDRVSAYASAMRAVFLAVGLGLISGCAPEPQCVWECFGNRQCVGDDLYVWRGQPLTAACRPDPMTCRREFVKRCSEGCLNDRCNEDNPPPPPPPPPPPVLPTVGTRCASDVDCQPAGRINTPEGPRQLVLHCGATLQCEDEVYERCNGIDDNDDDVVDEGCALAATLQPLAIAGRPISMVAHATDAIALTTDDDVIHFLGASLTETTTHTPQQAITLIPTRNGFAYAESYFASGSGVMTDIRLFNVDGTPSRRTTLSPSQRGSKLLAVIDESAWLLTIEGLVAFDLDDGMQGVTPPISVGLDFATPVFSAGQDVVLCLSTHTGWLAPDGMITFVNERCASNMTSAPNVLWGYDASFRRYRPRALSVAVAEIPPGARSPSFGTPHGGAFVANDTRALSAVAYPEAASPFVMLTEGSSDGAWHGYSAPIANDDVLIGGAQRGEVTILILHSDTLGTRALRFAPR